MATNAKSKATSKKRTSTKKSNSTKPSSRNNKAISRSTAPKKQSGARKSGSSNKNIKQSSHNIDYAEVLFWITIGVSIFIFVSNFGFCGKYGKAVSSLVMSLFGIVGYFIPFILIFAVAICLKKIRDVKALSKFICALILLILISTLIELWFSRGGSVGNILVSLLKPRIGSFGTCIAVLVLMIIDYIFIFETSAVNDMKKAGSKGKKAYSQGKQVYSQAKTKIRETVETAQSDPDKPLKRRDRKATNKGLTFNIGLQDSIPAEEKITEVKTPAKEKNEGRDLPPVSQDDLFNFTFETASGSEKAMTPQAVPVIVGDSASGGSVDDLMVPDEPSKSVKKKKNTKQMKEEIVKESQAVEESINAVNLKQGDLNNKNLYDSDLHSDNDASFDFRPSLEILNYGDVPENSDTAENDTRKTILGETLKSFGINIIAMDDTKTENPNEQEQDFNKLIKSTVGPSVTRFEFRPARGIKVAKIVGLADDLQLALEVKDIRIEAPIAGKAAVGLEVPNNKTYNVFLRDLLESENYKKSKSLLTYAVGMNIDKSIEIHDIAKMPHLLIAGATGSGKSVFINTLIVSILYKASPEDVKFIMIDPKMVELSVYNGLPHLLVPVVTDPKKAAGALSWAVAEMTKRYKSFAEEGVRDIQGYNDKIDQLNSIEDAEEPKKKMPKIVIIVDELADLMMVAPKDVEESICRLAQLARAAGIHLVIATQRPSVNVITGLIKANMPSRIALSVTSGIDSRTIIDMNGAEKLLGNGDMLFYPTGATKPVRIQGAYISDSEIQQVVADIMTKHGKLISSNDIEKEIEQQTVGNNITVAIGNSDNNERDSYFAEAGRLIIDKDKASIGMLQRQFKIGFNRAARIMDQLHEAGIVGPEEGTKPRKILMNASEFEQYLLDN